MTKEESEEDKNRAKCPKYIKRRNKVFAKDNYTCQCCGTVRIKIQAHHVFSFHSHKHLRYITTNGITLCENCHKKFHKEYKYTNNTKKQLNKFLK